jgi:drug/metabolite transporter (DMT)-like permease
MDDHFWRRLTRGTLPLLVWAAHFTFCYLLAAAQCTPGALRAGGPNRLLLGGVTLAALALCAWLAWRERAMLREDVRDKAGLLDWAAALGAVMAFVGIVWTGLPILLVEGCA